MKYDAVIFDLGNTLVSYYSREQWPGILARCIQKTALHLNSLGILRVTEADLPERTDVERRLDGPTVVMPLIERLARIFELTEDEIAGDKALEICRKFMKPIYATAHLYDDVLPTLAELKQRGFKLGILSNTPWGSPFELWREELARHGLADTVDAAAFCTEVGHRKPDPRPFEFIMEQLGVTADKSIFIGDDPRWDIEGPAGIGMAAMLIDRHGEFKTDHPTIKALSQLADKL